MESEKSTNNINNISENSIDNDKFRDKNININDNKLIENLDNIMNPNINLNDFMNLNNIKINVDQILKDIDTNINNNNQLNKLSYPKN